MSAPIAILALILAGQPAFSPSKDRLELLAQAEKELAATPDSVEAILKAALARKMAGRYEESLDLLMSCKHVRCGMMLAIAASLTDDAPRMLPLLERFTTVRQPPQDKAAALRFYSQALVRSGRPTEAINAARGAIEAYDAPMMHLDLAVALFAAGRITEAEETLDAALDKMPGQPTALYWKYRCLKQRSTEQATAVARKAIAALSQSVSDKLQDRGDLHFLLAEVAADLGEAERSKTHREIAARLHVTRHWPAPAGRAE